MIAMLHDDAKKLKHSVSFPKKLMKLILHPTNYIEYQDKVNLNYSTKWIISMTQWLALPECHHI